MSEAIDTRPRGDAAALKTLGLAAPSFLLSVLHASPDCIKIVELDGSLSFMNENGRCAMEIDDLDVMTGAPWPSLWPEAEYDRIVAALRAAGEGRSTRFEAYCPTAKGTPRWWDVSVAPVPDEDGRPARVVSISRDITERVEREAALARHEKELERLALAQAETLQEREALLKEKDLLMREVDHRVKNSLAIVTSLLKVQSRTEGDDHVQNALTRAAQRVGTIAGIHERLYRGEQLGRLDFGAYLRGLCADLEQSLGEGQGVAVAVEADETVMDADKATVLGLMVSELVTNAVRHAFAGRDGGRVAVRMDRQEDGVCLTVSDDGAGLPDGFDPHGANGLGMRVVVSYVRQQGWTLETGRADEGGAMFCIRMG